MTPNLITLRISTRPLIYSLPESKPYLIYEFLKMIMLIVTTTTIKKKNYKTSGRSLFQNTLVYVE